jgi:putative acetyltransferase
MSAAEIRPERPQDVAAVRRIHERAFPLPDEADLVDRLRADGDIVLALVAADPEPVGHIVFSRLLLPDPAVKATALAPVSVLPERQREGIGSALITEGLARLRDAGEDVVLVLGDPTYYSRFGFLTQAAKAFRSVYEGPYFQALPFTDAGRFAHGEVTYPPAFAALG